MPKVSIIIPFNNVENYIDECLRSVIAQTLEDIEIIMVNDASEDKSAQIVKNYMAKDNRIKLIEIPTRQGQGYARNRAIEIAKGEYIGFVDSDDIIAPDMFEQLYNTAVEYCTEITMCMAHEFDDVTKERIESDYYSLTPLKGFADSIFSAEDTKEQILDINVALWNKLSNALYLKSTRAKFPEGYIYEDLPFFYFSYLPASRIKIIWKDFYAYRVNRRTSTMRQMNNRVLDRIPMVSLTYDKVKNTPYLDSEKKKIQGWIINDLFHRYTLLKENCHREFFFGMKKVFESLEIENLEDEYWKSVYHFKGYKLVMNSTFEEFNQKVFNEYLDIHEVEDRLLSQITPKDELDNRFSNIYTDINKNYKYTEKIVNEAKRSILKNSEQNINLLTEKITASNDWLKQEITNGIDYSNVQTDEKISNVYEEITKNYEYTNNIRDDINQTIQAHQNEITNIYEKIALENQANQNYFISIKDDVYTYINQRTDETIEYQNKIKDDVYTYINQKNDETIEYQNNVKDDLYTYIDQRADETVEYQNKTKDDLYAYINQKTNETVEYQNKTKEDLYIFINQKSDEISANLNQTKDDIYSYINKTSDEIKTNLNQTKDKVYSYIDHQYEKAENNASEKVNQLETKLNEEIKNSSKIINNEINLRVGEVYAYTNSELAKAFKQLNENSHDFDKKLNYTSGEIYKLLNERKSEDEALKELLNQKADTQILTEVQNNWEYSQNKFINELRDEFENKLNKQRIKYENKLISMENKLKETEQVLLENKKNIFQKLWEKAKKR